MRFLNLSHLMRATKNSLSGLAIAWHGEQAFRHEVILLPIIMVLLLLLQPGFFWALILVCAWLLVLAVELLNSAIEQVCNKACPEYDILIKYSKDMASAAIFVVLCLNSILWLAMLWDVFIR